MVRRNITSEKLISMEFDLAANSPLAKIAGSRNSIQMSVGIALDNCLTPEQEVALFQTTLPDGTKKAKEPKMIMGAGTHEYKGEITVIPESYYLGEDVDGNFYRISVDSLREETKKIIDGEFTAFGGGSVKISEGFSIIDANLTDLREACISNENGFSNKYILKTFGLESAIENASVLIKGASDAPCSGELYNKAFAGYVGLSPEELQLAYVSKDGERIAEIRNPSHAVKTAAVNQNGLALLDIKQPTDEQREIAANKLADEVIAKYFPSSEPVAAGAASEKGLDSPDKLR